LFGIFSKNLIFFWILPYMFYFIFTINGWRSWLA
jgi:hypothetical protein